MNASNFIVKKKILNKVGGKKTKKMTKQQNDKTQKEI